MELDKLIIEISADDAAFVRSLNQNNKLLKDFGITGTATADQLTKALASIARESKKATDPEQIQKLSAVYNYLNGRLAIVNENIRKFAIQVDDSGRVIEPFGKKTKKGADSLTDVDEASRRARIAVYGLNQVVRDLPFGFIAISNNIPVLIDQFQELIKTKGNTKAAFKEFAAGLLGAGGVSVAISAVISLITSAVQKYGSLSNAVTALTTDLGPLIQQLNEANKQYEKFLKESLSVTEVGVVSGIASSAEISRLDNLINALRDRNKTEAEKEAILKRVQKLDGGIFQGYELQVNKIDDVIRALELYKSSLRNTTSEKNYARNLDDTVSKLQDTKTQLDRVNAQLAQARKNEAAATAQYLKTQQEGQRTAGNLIPSLGFGKFTTEIPKLLELQKELETRYRGLTILQFEYGNAVDKSTNEQITSISKVNEFVAANFKKTEKQQTTTNDKRLSNNLATLQAQLAQEKSYLGTLNTLSKQFEDQQIKIATLERDIKAAQLQKQITDRQQLSDAIKAIDIDLQNEINKIVGDNVTKRVEYWKAEADAAKKAAEESAKALQIIPKAVPDSANIINPQKVQEFLKQVDASRQSFVENEKARLQELTDQALVFANAIGNFTGDFVQGLLNGESAIEGLIDGMKQLAKEIAIAAAKAIALELVYAALNIASGGTAGTATKAGTGILQNLFGRRGVAAPNINPTVGMPIGPGGMAIRGNVTFVQRGQDLVGVLARSNARINRVG